MRYPKNQHELVVRANINASVLPRHPASANAGTDFILPDVCRVVNRRRPSLISLPFLDSYLVLPAVISGSFVSLSESSIVP